MKIMSYLRAEVVMKQNEEEQDVEGGKHGSSQCFIDIAIL